MKLVQESESGYMRERLNTEDREMGDRKMSPGQAPFVSKEKSLVQGQWRLKWALEAKIRTCRRLIRTRFIITWKQKHHI